MEIRLAKIVLALASAMALVSGPWPRETAGASCVGPTLTIDGNPGYERRPNLQVDSTLTVDGVGFANGCHDQGTSSTFGCSARHDDSATPMVDVQLRLRQGNREWDLGDADAGSADNNRLGQVTWIATLPDGVKPGKARLVTDQSQPLKVTVVAADEE